MSDGAASASPLAAVGEAPAHCPRCVYDLAGLPERHACPECGFEYDADTLLIYGTAWGQTPVDGWIRYYWIVFPGLVLLGRFTDSFVVTQLAWIAVGFGILGFLVWRWRRRQRLGGNAQLLVTEQGVSLRDGPGEPKWRSWEGIRDVRVRRLWTWGLSWRRPLRPRWSITFSSGTTPFDPAKVYGAPMMRGGLWISVGFEASAAEAERVRRVVERIRAAAGGEERPPRNTRHP